MRQLFNFNCMCYLRKKLRRQLRECVCVCASAERARSFFLCPSKVTSHFHNAYEKRALCFALLEHISPFGHCLHFSLSFLLMAFSILFLKNKLSVHAHECTLVSYSFSAAAGWFLFWDFHFCWITHARTRQRQRRQSAREEIKKSRVSSAECDELNYIMRARSKFTPTALYRKSSSSAILPPHCPLFFSWLH